MRLAVSAAAIASVRASYEETLAFCRERVVGGQPLISNQVVAHKLAETLTTVESCEAFIDATASMIKVTKDGMLGADLVARLARLKAHCCSILLSIAPDMQKLQGLHGLKTNSITRQVCIDAIGFEHASGSSNVLLNTAVKQMRWTATNKTSC